MTDFQSGRRIILNLILLIAFHQKPPVWKALRIDDSVTKLYTKHSWWPSFRSENFCQQTLTLVVLCPCAQKLHIQKSAFWNCLICAGAGALEGSYTSVAPDKVQFWSVYARLSVYSSTFVECRHPLASLWSCGLTCGNLLCKPFWLSCRTYIS